ncbi:TPA: Lrp/AsnC family transcriptional regulator [Candidatus Woesearchaeota archaeon]|nr:Lrp/AsnC family transcriptional regulator [Candidatus Woesearchaeota archaeon]HIH31147.1 Lrp/AsnC family transcriptional regulator [Candidatus Woesearchaeota archaeon]HIH54628.1 Lrp/AsnC family transcriptional regulator [Candidatus Woesearchaeota archaeon]HIJ02319.1 Lrp/AsnC family transcriptional regulator [Candidatus Woesearchaeota archaeon]HIJ14204.1 Lrp/AsnC family transcriptional regulator [Candidatus Woesearchaeota archaeon]
MAYKLDVFDKKILYALDKKSNISLAELSRKISRSKPFVIYRIKRLESEGIITGYYAIIDMSKLGYFTFRVYLKFQQMNIEDGKTFVSFVKENLSQVWTITSMLGKWDYALFLGVKNVSEFHHIWKIIMNKYKERIKSYNVSVYAPIFNFNRSFFIDEKEMPLLREYGLGNKVDIDEKDVKIIEAYASDVRQSSIDIAKKVKLSQEAVRYRIKNLEKKKVIIGYKIGMNLEVMGYTSYRVDFHLNSTSKSKELFEFCRFHKNIYQVNDSIGGADFEIEVIVKDLPELVSLIDSVKIRFKGVINDVDYFGFSTFHILKYIPD